MLPAAHAGHYAEPVGTQVREIGLKILKEKDYPPPSAQYWYDEIRRRYPLQGNTSMWTEKQILKGLKGELEHNYPRKPNQLTTLEESEKEHLLGRNFNTAIRKLREQKYFLPPWRQEPFFEDEEISKLGYSMDGDVFGGQITSAIRNFEQDIIYQVVTEENPFPTFSTM